jgi:hypothetical protein
MYALSRDSGAELVNTEWKPKKIIIEGTIQGSSISDLETNIDSFKLLMSGENKNLDIQYETGTRRYVATASVIQIERDFYHLNYAPYSVEFQIPDGDGKSTTSLSHSTTSIVVSSLETDSFDIVGTKIPKYTIGITFVVATDVTSVTVTINGDAITVSEAISAGQVLVIDAENKKCTLDGTEKRYTGLFPRLILGNNAYKIATSATARQYNVMVTYTPTYL